MQTFIQNIEQTNNINLDSIKNAARKALPEEYRKCPWTLTCQGGSDPNNTSIKASLQELSNCWMSHCQDR